MQSTGTLSTFVTQKGTSIMAKASSIPVYDICTINQQSGSQELLIERLGTYLAKHYHQLHRPHRHSFYHLVLFTAGKGHHSIDFVQFPVQPFQLYCMAPGQVHSWHFEGAPEGYVVHFNESFFSSFLQHTHYLERFSFFNGLAADGVLQLPLAIQTEAVQLFETLVQEVAEAGELSQDRIRLKLLELFILVNRHSDSKKRYLPQQKYLLLRNFQQLIGKHYRNIRLPKEYAELLYVTPNHLNALCQELLHKTAGELIRDRVLLESKRLLTNAGISIAEISYELNFQDNSYFNRFFKKYVGVTPEMFRKNCIHQ